MKLSCKSGATIATAAAALMMSGAAVLAQADRPEATATVNCFIGDAKEPQALVMKECEEQGGKLEPSDKSTHVNCLIGDATEPQSIPMSECEEKGGKLQTVVEAPDKAPEVEKEAVVKEPIDKEMVVKCYGINSCAGKSACKTAHSECAGKNSCAGKGYVEIKYHECQAQGGKLEPPA